MILSEYKGSESLPLCMGAVESHIGSRLNLLVMMMDNIAD
jgi:hypothetical protein